MEKIACIIGHTYIYWSAVISTLAVCAAVCIFLALYLQEGNAVTAAVCVPFAIALSLLLARVAHWYFRSDRYESFEVAVKYLSGDYALLGAFAGCFLTAVMLRLVKLTDNFPALLDCMALAGGTGIALGRLAFFFNSSDRGRIVNLDMGLPWVIAAMNPVSGIMEHRLATFLLQAIACGLICLALLVFYLTGKRRQGDTALLFLLFYGAAQVILDSTRYDALYFRSNGFIRVVQVLCAAAAALVSVIFAVRMVRAGGWKKWHIALWLVQAGSFSLAGYMEYYVQRHGGEAKFAYSVMGVALLGVLLSALVTRHMASVEEKNHAQWLLRLSGHQKEGDL